MGRHNEAPFLLKAWAYAKELWHRFSKKIASYWYVTAPDHYLGLVVGGRAPLVLLPGVGNKWGYMQKFGSFFSLAGHPVYIIPELNNNLQSVPEAAATVKHFIESKNLSGVIFLAHSKGGLVGKYYMAHHNADGRALGLVAIATPFSGTSSANSYTHPAFQELREDSPIVMELEKIHNANNRIYSIYPQYDTHIWGQKGSFLKGAAGNIQIPTGGHNALLFDKRVLKAVSESIEKLSVLI